MVDIKSLSCFFHGEDTHKSQYIYSLNYGLSIFCCPFKCSVNREMFLCVIPQSGSNKIWVTCTIMKSQS